MGAISLRSNYGSNDLGNLLKVFTQGTGKESTVNLSVINSNKPDGSGSGLNDYKDLQSTADTARNLGLFVRAFVADPDVTLTVSNCEDYMYGKSALLLPVVCAAYWDGISVASNVLAGKSNVAKYEKIVLKPRQSIYIQALGPFNSFTGGQFNGFTPTDVGLSLINFVARVEGFEDTV